MSSISLKNRYTRRACIFADSCSVRSIRDFRHKCFYTNCKEEQLNVSQRRGGMGPMLQ